MLSRPVTDKQTELLRSSDPLGIPVQVYEPLSHRSMFGLIRDVDSDLSDDEIAQNLRSPDQHVFFTRSDYNELLVAANLTQSFFAEMD